MRNFLIQRLINLVCLPAIDQKQDIYTSWMLIQHHNENKIKDELKILCRSFGPAELQFFSHCFQKLLVILLYLKRPFPQNIFYFFMVQ
jgi:hypothetical protein